jgi:hypothetical protein
LEELGITKELVEKDKEIKEIKEALINYNNLNEYDEYFFDFNPYLWESNRKNNSQEVLININLVHTLLRVPISKFCVNRYFSNIAVLACVRSNETLYFYNQLEDNIFSNGRGLKIKGINVDIDTIYYGIKYYLSPILKYGIMILNKNDNTLSISLEATKEELELNRESINKLDIKENKTNFIINKDKIIDDTNEMNPDIFYLIEVVNTFLLRSSEIIEFKEVKEVSAPYGR